MTDKRYAKALKFVFGEYIPSKTTWNMTMSQLEILGDIIPGSRFFFQRVDELDKNYWKVAVRSAKIAKKEEDEGKSLYMITEAEDEIHWFSMDEKYEFLVELLEPYVNLEGYFEQFYAAQGLEGALEMAREMGER